MGKELYRMFNFPVSLLPLIFNRCTLSRSNYKKHLREEVIDFAVLYATRKTNPSIDEIQDVLQRFSIEADPSNIIRSGQKFYNDWYYNRTPLTFIWSNELWAFINSDYKSEADLITLRAALALRSIGRNGREIKTTLAMIFARMEGMSEPSGKPSKSLAKWMTRKRWENIKSGLEENYSILFDKGRHRGIVCKLHDESS